jgi:hypothetical protein
MPVSFQCTDKEDVGEHCYRVHAPDPETDWVGELAREYVGLRTACGTPLVDVSLDGLEDIVDVTAIRARLHAAAIPRRRQGNFDVVRSDFGETMAYSLLEQEYATKFGYKSVRDRELVQSPGRGIDAVGVEEGAKLTLVLGETKVSDEDRCPPRVVDENDDSMRNQHRGHMEDRTVTANKLLDWARRIPDPELQERFFRAALLLERDMWDRLRVVACCVLVRPAERFAKGDYGTFYSDAVDFAPADVRFLTVCLPERVEPTVQTWYDAVGSTEAAA